MKNLLYIIIASLTLSSCARKAVKVVTVENVATSEVESAKTFVHVDIDTSSSDELEYTYTKVEFYQPSEVKVDTSKRNPYIIHTTDVNASGQAFAPDRAFVHWGYAPKSVETVTIKKKSSKAGIVKKDSIAVEKQSREVVTQHETKIEKKPAKDPHRWRYIFYILLLVTIVSAYFFIAKKFNPWHWIKKILGL
ncbi:hypothetical protein [Leadbetterella byssophila]|uniref:hypothetical protein n=1 Tax=Leadbetterella byssophila TaxID=316068 RepID=UPI0039A219FE